MNNDDYTNEDYTYQPWGIDIRRADNGYVCRCYGADTEYVEVIQEMIDNDISEDVEKVAMYNLLWTVLDYFDQGGCKHDKERIKINIEKRDDQMGIIGDAYCPTCDKLYRACYGVDEKRDLIENGISMEYGNLYVCRFCGDPNVYFKEIVMWVDQMKAPCANCYCRKEVKLHTDGRLYCVFCHPAWGDSGELERLKNIFGMSDQYMFHYAIVNKSVNVTRT